MKLASSSGAKGTKGAQAPLHTDERRHFDFGASGGKELASRQAANNGAERGRFQTKFDAQNLDFKIFVLSKSLSEHFGIFYHWHKY